MSQVFTQLILKGYAVTTTSWDNDGDDYQDQTIGGLSYEDACMYYDLAKLFAVPENTRKMTKAQYTALYEACGDILRRHPDSAIAVANIDDEHPIKEKENIVRLVTRVCGDGDFASRYVETIVIIYVPETIRFIDLTAAIANDVSKLTAASTTED